MLSGFSVKRGQDSGPSDTIDLTNFTAGDSQTGGTLTARIFRIYDAGSGAREGELWYNNNGEENSKSTDVVTPNANIDNYYIKWNALTGDVPNNPDAGSAAQDTWIAMSGGDYFISISVTQGNVKEGTFDVAISSSASGTPLLDNCTCDFVFESEDTGK